MNSARTGPSIREYLAFTVASRHEQLEEALKRVRTQFLSKYAQTAEMAPIVDTWTTGMKKTFFSNAWRTNLLDGGKYRVLCEYIQLVTDLIEENRMSFDEVCYALTQLSSGPSS